MSASALEFSIFCIEEVAMKLRLPGNVVYDMLTSQSDILNGYIVPSYDVLHTQGKDYITSDIISLMKAKGLVA